MKNHREAFCKRIGDAFDEESIIRKDVVFLDFTMIHWGIALPLFLDFKIINGEFKDFGL